MDRGIRKAKAKMSTVPQAEKERTMKEEPRADMKILSTQGQSFAKLSSEQWAKAVQDYDRVARERDEWKAHAQEMQEQAKKAGDAVDEARKERDEWKRRAEEAGQMRDTNCDSLMRCIDEREALGEIISELRREISKAPVTVCDWRSCPDAEHDGLKRAIAIDIPRATKLAEARRAVCAAGIRWWAGDGAVDAVYNALAELRKLES